MVSNLRLRFYLVAKILTPALVYMLEAMTLTMLSRTSWIR